MHDSGSPLLKTALTVLLAVVTIFLVTEPAYAYADPGTAGLLYQIVVIIFASLVSYFLFFKDFLKRLFKRKSEEKPEKADPQD
jgi:membrane protease YdiL (CAAX protease family)